MDCSAEARRAPIQPKAALLFRLETGLAGVELFVGQLEPVVFPVERDPTDRDDLVAAQVAAASSGLPRLPGFLRLFGVHRISPPHEWLANLPHHFTGDVILYTAHNAIRA